ncbi:MAG: hypothetical protein AAGU26_10600 [bacterium]
MPKSRRLSLLLLFAFCSVVAFSQVSESDTPPGISPDLQTSLPNDLAQIPSSELLIVLRTRVLEISSELSRINGLLMNSETRIQELETLSADREKDLATSYAYSTSLSTERATLEKEKRALELKIEQLETDIKKAEQQRDIWKSAAFLTAGAGVGFAIAGPVGAAIGAGVGAIVGILF